MGRAGCQLGERFPNGAHAERTESGRARSVHGSGRADLIRNRASHFGMIDLHLDNDPNVRVATEHLPEGGYGNTLIAKWELTLSQREPVPCIDSGKLSGGQGGHRPRRIRCAVERWVVTDDRNTVGRQMDVEFESVSTGRHSPVERGESVLGSESTTTPVCKHARFGELEEMPNAQCAMPNANAKCPRLGLRIGD